MYLWPQCWGWGSFNEEASSLPQIGELWEYWKKDLSKNIWLKMIEGDTWYWPLALSFWFSLIHRDACIFVGWREQSLSINDCNNHLIYTDIYTYICVRACVCVHVCLYKHMCNKSQVWRSEGDFWELVLSYLWIWGSDSGGQACCCAFVLTGPPRWAMIMSFQEIQAPSKSFTEEDMVCN